MIPEWKNTQRQTHTRSRLSESGSAEALCRSRISVNEILDPAPEQVYIKQPTRLCLLFVLQHSIEPNPPRLSYDPISSPSYDQQNTPIFSNHLHPPLPIHDDDEIHPRYSLRPLRHPAFYVGFCAPHLGVARCLCSASNFTCHWHNLDRRLQAERHLVCITEHSVSD